ncbi:pyridoxamine 5'-phosphate oxidase family protein [Aeromicrobium sp. CF3.5]|uniref:pyridoxamine 5'-phosphate oxidase family protein n=1 Tax=Aeromicrobium sp. CF3.5 TaxID=3373078 RepID=UPI003EE6FBC6
MTEHVPTSPTPTTVTTNSHFTVLTEDECLDLLTTTTVGRIAFVDDEGLQLLPLNFAVVDGEIYFRTDPSSVLHALGEGCAVAFEIDHHSEVSPSGWNVTVKGSTKRVSDPDLRDHVIVTPALRPWAGGPRGEVIHLSRSSLGGRRVRRT